MGESQKRTLLFRNTLVLSGSYDNVIFSAMNLDRLVAILRPLAYLEAVRHQLKKDIKRQMLETEALSRFFIIRQGRKGSACQC